MKEKLKILNFLLIEDNKNDRALIKAHLKSKFDNTVFTFADGKEEYLEKVSWIKPDVIICDFELKDCNGLDILLLSRANSDTPFIFITGKLTDDHQLTLSLLQGASGYVLKDNMGRLAEIVQKVIEHHETQSAIKDAKLESLRQIKINLEKTKSLIEGYEISQETIDLLSSTIQLLDNVK